MPLIVEAIYEDGVLKPIEPLSLPEHTKVKLTVHPEVSLAQQTAGMIPWTGDPATLERLATDPEFGLLESP
jgi:predicted DNA-binding antitoxin AbrB/MazE fold protein